MVGFVPSFFRSFLCVMNIGTRVPSFDVTNTRSVVYGAGVERELSVLELRALAGWPGRTANTVRGNSGDVNE